MQNIIGDTKFEWDIIFLDSLKKFNNTDKRLKFEKGKANPRRELPKIDF